MTQRRRFFPSTPVQTVPGRSVEFEMQVRPAGVVTVPTPTAPTAPAPEGVVVVDADFLVIRYVFTQADGRDLDTRTRIYSPVLAPINFLGWARNDYVERLDGVRGSIYARWGGDNTGYGIESVMVDVRQVAAEFSTAVLSIETRAFWYGERRAGSCLLTVDVYKGGAMSLADYEFSNLGGALVASISKSVDVPTLLSEDIDGDFITFVCYDIPSRRLSFDCSPAEPGIPIEGKNDSHEDGEDGEDGEGGEGGDTETDPADLF